MTDDEFTEVSQALVKHSGNQPYVLVMHDEETRELRLSSNLTVESLQSMLEQALDKSATLDPNDRIMLQERDKKH